MIGTIEEALDRYQAAPAVAGLEPLADSTHRYAEFLWKHMTSEESSVIPECQQHLTEGDWQVIARAFENNGDPRFDRELEAGYEKVFAHLMRLAKKVG